MFLMFTRVQRDKGIEWFRVMTADDDVSKEVGGTIGRGRSFVGSLHK